MKEHRCCFFFILAFSGAKEAICKFCFAPRDKILNQFRLVCLPQAEKNKNIFAKCDDIDNVTIWMWLTSSATNRGWITRYANADRECSHVDWFFIEKFLLLLILCLARRSSRPNWNVNRWSATMVEHSRRAIWLPLWAFDSTVRLNFGRWSAILQTTTTPSHCLCVFLITALVASCRLIVFFETHNVQHARNRFELLHCVCHLKFWYLSRRSVASVW